MVCTYFDVGLVHRRQRTGPFKFAVWTAGFRVNGVTLLGIGSKQHYPEIVYGMVECPCFLYQGL